MNNFKIEIVADPNVNIIMAWIMAMFPNWNSSRSTRFMIDQSCEPLLAILDSPHGDKKNKLSNLTKRRLK